MTKKCFKVDRLELFVIILNPTTGSKSKKPSTTPFFLQNSFFLSVTLIITFIGLLAKQFPLSADKTLSDVLVNLDSFVFPSHWNLRKDTLVDSMIAFITWSTTYLFVRRLLNPETFSVAIERFSADAFFGGLAASTASVFKSVLYAILVKH